MALLGHELRHAVELAEAPAVDDGDDYERLYDRIGYLSCTRAAPRCYETVAAVRAGRAVLGELREADDCALIGAPSYSVAGASPARRPSRQRA